MNNMSNINNIWVFSEHHNQSRTLQTQQLRIHTIRNPLANFTLWESLWVLWITPVNSLIH